MFATLETEKGQGALKASDEITLEMALDEELGNGYQTATATIGNFDTTCVLPGQAAHT